jgi:hypothetical protein
MQNQVVLKFGAIGQNLKFVGCTEVARMVQDTFWGWDITHQDLRPREKPSLATVTRLRKYFRWDAKAAREPVQWKEAFPATTNNHLLCDIHYEASQWYLNHNPRHLCLHCSAIQFGNSIVMFPADKKAGKSTLSMRLAERGHRIFGDDVVAIEPRHGHAMSLGLAPRLRLPLAEQEGREHAEYVASRRGPSDKKYQYLNLHQSEFAPLAETRPISGVVLLSRKDDGKAKLEMVNRGIAVKHMIRKNFATSIKPSSIFDQILAATEQASFRQLTYARCDDAIEVLQREFGGP